MAMTLVPDWAPNLHPLVVHFPIAWLIAAVIVDLVALVLPRAAWAATTAAVLYPVGAASAIAAYLTGRQAAASVLVPGMAHTILRDHWNWALATTICYGLIAVLRVALLLRRGPPPRWARLSLAIAALLGMLLLFYTGEQGARLVYEYGTGVRMPAAPR